MKPFNRDYGYGDSPEPTKPPEIKSGPLDESCPNCEGKTLFMLEVTVPNNPVMAGMLGSKEGVGVYMGCAACPFASPMMTRAK